MWKFCDRPTVSIMQRFVFSLTVVAFALTWRPVSSLGQTEITESSAAAPDEEASVRDAMASSSAQGETSQGIDKESRKRQWPSDGTIGESFRDVAKELRCPTCTGLSVLESDAAFSVQIKDIVKEQVEAGKSKEEILKYFTARFGPWILRSPPVSGFNIWAWAVPVGLLVLGPPLIWFFIWRKRRVVSTLGVRPDETIIREMQERLTHLRASSTGQKV